ncbi:hypothetical protein ADL12_19560 [Streptomyces regalis]|uniref:Uncharacterized protein n=1 Tax=Streptomyces regalis TaxID=68262 RepID=A0A0X3UUL0_9ACTN|nr:hypothetical protein ADL12_19560 [Streptomyces regalis]
MTGFWTSFQPIPLRNTSIPKKTPLGAFVAVLVPPETQLLTVSHQSWPSSSTRLIGFPPVKA